jgi:hypothetical protein
MPRKARLNVPGAVYHVMGRCLDYVTLFADDADREQFLSLRMVIADYLGVGMTAASAMSRSGKEIVKKHTIVI